MSTRYFVQSMEIKIRFPECLRACNILLTQGAPPDFQECILLRFHPAELL